MHNTLRTPRRSASYRLSGLLALASVLLIAALYDSGFTDTTPVESQALVIVAPEPGWFDVETLEKLVVDFLRQIQIELEDLIQAVDGRQKTPLTAQQPVWKTPPPLPVPSQRHPQPTLIQL